MTPGPRIALPSTPLRDGSTLVRRWRDDDLDDLVALCQDPEIIRWTRIPAAYGPRDAREYLDGAAEAARIGVAATLAVADADAGAAAIGSVGLLRFSWPDRRAEVGYWLGADARGRGHMTRAVSLICGLGFRELSLERITLLAAAANPASQAVARRAGFRREARLRSYDDGPDGRRDFICFGALASDGIGAHAATG